MILCCRIPDIPIAALLLRHDGVAPPGSGAAPGTPLQGRPVVVGGLPGERKPVRSASPEARAFGVCPGMPLRQAEQLCPQALFLPLDPEAERMLARHLLAGLYALAPRVELAQESGEAYVDLGGMGLLNGGIEAFATRVGGYLETRLRTRPRLGIGSNKFVAYTAAGMDTAVPVLVAQGGERSFLAPLTLAGHLPVDPALVERLQLFGLRRMSDLAALPLAAVEAQFGQEGLWALRLARGEDSRPLLAWEPPQRMEEVSRLDPAVDNLEPLLFLARGLVERLGSRLLEGGHAATVVRLRLEFEDGTRAALEPVLRLRAPMSTGDEMWTPVSALIRRQRVEVPVAAISLRVSGFCPAGSRQMDLLVRRDGKLEDIARQVSMLADAHGPSLLRTPRLPAVPSLLDERRYHWRDPAEVLVPPPARKGRRARAASR